MASPYIINCSMEGPSINRHSPFGLSTTIIEAVKAGELDKQLTAAMVERRLKLKKVG